jgi:hypothetical protein
MLNNNVNHINEEVLNSYDRQVKNHSQEQFVDVKMKTSSVGFKGIHSCSFPGTFDCSGASRNGYDVTWMGGR